MDGWKNRLTWLRMLPQLPDPSARTPLKTAEAELQQYLKAHPEETCSLSLDPDAGDAYTAPTGGSSAKR